MNSLTGVRPFCVGGAALSGSKLVRIAYLDEAGISNASHEPYLVVAAVIVHGDTQWRPIESELYDIIDTDIPPEMRDGFVFHATELFGGGKKLKRDEWPRERRWAILDKIVALPRKYRLPIASFYAERLPSPPPGWTHEAVIGLQQTIATIGCENAIQKWMSQNAPDEVVKITAEDHPRKKHFLRAMHDIARNPRHIARLEHAVGYPAISKNLPFTNIVDTIAFEDKKASPLLQLADACAFAIKRGLMSASNYERFLEPLSGQMIKL